MMKTSLVSLIVASAALAACGGAPVPADKLARSAASVKAAEELGADKDPTAAVHLRLAREELQAGKDLVTKDDNERASYVFQKSEADGNAALELARAAQSKVEVEKTKEMINSTKTKLGGAQ